MAPLELEWLNGKASMMHGSVVEVGSLHGRSSYALGLDCPGEVYCIDPWNDAGWKSWSASLAPLTNVHGIREPSPQAGVHVPDPVDMVFIDGAHDYDSVVADITYWRSRCQVLLCGHDYVPFSALRGNEPGFPDVKVAVDELLGDSVRVADGCAIWYIEMT
jgi:predicted O-methyltransferase YrrM